MHALGAPSTADALAALSQLLGAAARLAETLSAPDDDARQELVDCLAIARINVLRLNTDGSGGGTSA